jgi:putative glutamine amidotransferase
MKPKILLTGEEGFTKGMMQFVISRDYINSVSRAGGLPLLAASLADSASYVDLADGLLLTGGMDLHCYRYGDYYREAAHVPPYSRTRDDMDMILCKAFLSAKKPVFGIGRGLQVINVALGGTLYQDLERDLGKGKTHCASKQDAEGYCEATTHSVQVLKNTRFFADLDPVQTVGSCHHQAVRDLAADLAVTASAEDGIIEALEHKTLPCFACQWHPERDLGEGRADLRLFETFIQLCKEGK